MSNPQKVAIVTGVSSGIGRATAETLAAAGYHVYGTVRSETTRAPEGIEALRLDVRDQDSINAAIGKVLAQSRRIDVLVNNAGGALTRAIEETNIDEAQALFDVNFFGVARSRALCCRQCARNARGG